MRIDSHQHVWTTPLLIELSKRSVTPQVEWVEGQALLEMTGEGPYPIDVAGEAPSRRTALLEQDGVELALVAISSPVGIESLPRREALSLIEAQLDGVAALGPRFAAWGPIALDRPNAEDVDRALARGCIGISLPAGALASPQRIGTLCSVLERIAQRGVPLFVHPGPAPEAPSPWHRPDVDHGVPGWWVPMTDYVAQMQAAWLSFAVRGRSDHPDLTVLFAMLAGGAPILADRLYGRGGPKVEVRDPRTFYDTSSFGADVIAAFSRLVGEEQLVYGSDRPVVEPVKSDHNARLQENGGRLLALSADQGARTECAA